MNPEKDLLMTAKCQKCGNESTKVKGSQTSCFQFNMGSNNPCFVCDYRADELGSDWKQSQLKVRPEFGPGRKR